MCINRPENRLVSPAATRVSAADARGFTLVELLMTMAIIAILATLAMTTINNAKDKAKTARAMTEIRMLEKEIAAYAAERAANPPQLVDIGRALAGSPNVCTMLDPWGQPYVYSATPTRTSAGPLINSDYDLYSKGPNALSAGLSIVDDFDDIIRAKDGGFTGPAVRYGL